MKVISAPVAATRYGSRSTASCTSGTAKNPARAPWAKLPVAMVPAPHTPHASRKVGGEITARPPTKVSSERPPRNPARTGQA